MRRQPHPYADDLINYLRVTFMNLATLPPSIREAVHFTCMAHVCNAILEQITGPNVSDKTIQDKKKNRERGSIVAAA